MRENGMIKFSTLTSNIKRIDDMVKKVNRKLAKYGKNEKVEYTIGQEYDYKCMLDGYTIVVQLVDVEITDLTISLNIKHNVVARLEKVNDSMVVTIYDRKYKVEDFNSIESIKCDHCHTNRMRKKGYILENIENGELIQVGHTCMSDYTHDLAIMDKLNFKNDIYGDDLVFDDMDYMRLTLGANNWLPIEDVLAYTNRIVKEDGKFISISEADTLGIKSTKDRVEKLTLINSTPITDEEYKVVNDMIETIKECKIEKIINNDFNIKIMDIVKNKYCNKNQIGLGIWTYKLYEKIVSYKEVKKIDSLNEYVGNVGDKIEIELKSIGNIWFDSYYGNSCMNKFIDKQGHIFVWYTTKEVNTNEEYKLFKATIKEHKEYKGDKQTIITRAKMNK